MRPRIRQPRFEYGAHRPPPQGANPASGYPELPLQTFLAPRKICYTRAPSSPRLGKNPPIMNAPIEMKVDEVLRVKLEVLRREHRDLDQAIHELETAQRADQLTLRRLKKQKLQLRDRIRLVEDQITPDIIA